MTYATRLDLEQRFTAVEIAQLESSGRNVAMALADADAEIDSYLGVRYAVPLTAPVPARVVEAACDLGYSRFFTINSDGEPASRRAAQIQWLRDVSMGKADVIGLTPRGDSTAAQGIGTVRTGQAKTGFDWCGY
jgi:phage gp36-like protein